MTDSNVKTVRDLIKSKVDQMGQLNGVFDYATGKNTGYPFATVTPEAGTSEFAEAKGRNLQTMQFIVRLYQEREDHLFGPEKAENVSLNVLDELLTAFHQDTTLSGAVLWQRPISWAGSYDVRDQIVRTLEVTIEAVKEIDTT